MADEVVSSYRTAACIVIEAVPGAVTPPAAAGRPRGHARLLLAYNTRSPTTSRPSCRQGPPASPSRWLALPRPRARRPAARPAVPRGADHLRLGQCRHTARCHRRGAGRGARSAAQGPVAHLRDVRGARGGRRPQPARPRPGSATLDTLVHPERGFGGEDAGPAWERRALAVVASRGRWRRSSTPSSARLETVKPGPPVDVRLPRSIFALHAARRRGRRRPTSSCWCTARPAGR